LKFLIPNEIETFLNLDTKESKVFYIFIPIEIHGKTFVIPIENETQLENEAY